MPGDIIILQKCTKNHDHMLHCTYIFHFGLFFAILHPPTPLPPVSLSLLDPIKQNIKKNYGVKDIESWMPHLKIYRVQIKYYKVIHKSYKSYWGGSNHHG